MSDFFDAPQAAAKLKHAILRNYLPIFATKTASSAPGRRAVYIDGYAGRGEYRDGTPGSPLIAMRVATDVAAQRPPKRLDCYFVEKDADYFAHLYSLVSDRARRGTIQRHLEELLAKSRGAPLFMFVDPFGLGLPVATLSQQVLGRLPGGRPQPTEVLLHFSITTLQRQGGKLDSDHALDPTAPATLEAIDRALDGRWWREIWQPGSLEAERTVAIEYCARLERRTQGRFRPWMVPVSDTWMAERPSYYLILLTSHPQGGWFFADALARAIPDYYTAVEPNLFSPDAMKAGAVDTIARNIEQQLIAAGPFVLIDRTREVFGEAFGWGGEVEIREALRRLADTGVIEPTKGDVKDRRIQPRTTPFQGSLL